MAEGLPRFFNVQNGDTKEDIAARSPLLSKGIDVNIEDAVRSGALVPRVELIGYGDGTPLITRVVYDVPQE